MHTPHVRSGGRYPMLRALAIIYVIGAALAAVATVIGLFYLLFAGDGSFGDRVIQATASMVSTMRNPPAIAAAAWMTRSPNDPSPANSR